MGGGRWVVGRRKVERVRGYGERQEEVEMVGRSGKNDGGRERGKDGGH